MATLGHPGPPLGDWAVALSVASVGSGLSRPACLWSRRPLPAQKPAFGGEGEPRAGSGVLSCTSRWDPPLQGPVASWASPLYQGDTSQPRPAALGVLGLGSGPHEKSRDAEQTHGGAEGLSSGPGPAPATEHGRCPLRECGVFIHQGRDRPPRPAHRLQPAWESGTTGVGRVPPWPSTLPHPPNALRHFLESWVERPFVVSPEGSHQKNETKQEACESRNKARVWECAGVSVPYLKALRRRAHHQAALGCMWVRHRIPQRYCEPAPGSLS